MVSKSDKSALSQLKKRSKSNISDLQKKIAETVKGKNTSYQDERKWKPQRDTKTQKGDFLIRFLPTSREDGEDALPWIKYWDHGFKGSGGWYFEKSLTSLNQDDPVSEYNSELWATGLEENKAIARIQKRRLHYVSNIIVLKDKNRPDNEGKVFLYEYGPSIFEKVAEACGEDGENTDIFDFWEGANFKIKMKTSADGYVKYDNSVFESPSSFGTDEEILEIWNQCYSLKEFNDPSSYKSYDELKSRLKKVLRESSVSIIDIEESVTETPSLPSLKETESSTIENNEDTESLDYFKKLASGDADTDTDIVGDIPF